MATDTMQYSPSISPVSSISHRQPDQRDEHHDPTNGKISSTAPDLDVAHPPHSEQHHIESQEAGHAVSQKPLLGEDSSIPAQRRGLGAENFDDASHGHEMEKDHRRSHELIGRFWLWEILSCLFSFLCMGAVIGVLAYEDGKPLDQWGFRVTPNAVVSFIAALAKSSFLLVIAETISQQKWLHFAQGPQKLNDLNIFDEASRGPLGSLQLLTLKHKNALIASGAAIVTILALFVDPFVQLVFTFPSQRTISPMMNASFLTTRMHDPMGYELNSHAPNTGAASVDARMQAAMIQGLYNGTASPSIICTTGNCTWTSPTTLGVCGGCTEITEQLNSTCLPTDGMRGGRSTCNYTLTQGSTLSGYSQLRGATGLIGQTRWNSTAAITTSLRPGDDAVLAAFQAVQVPQEGTSHDRETYNMLPPAKAFECDFNVCAKTYPEVQVSSGIVQLPAPEEKRLIFDPNDHECVGSGSCENRHQFYKLISNDDSSGVTDRVTYQINVADFYNIGNYLKEMFSSGWTNDGDLTRPASNTLSTAPDVGRELAKTPDLNGVVIALAESMTEAMRTGPNSTAHFGQTYVDKTMVKIRWAYLAYPIVLSLFSMVLLLIVILQTQQLDVIAWKSSSLALLVHRLSGWEMADGAVNSKRDLHRAMGRIRARLCDDGTHAEFITDK